MSMYAEINYEEAFAIQKEFVGKIKLPDGSFITTWHCLRSPRFLIEYKKKLYAMTITSDIQEMVDQINKSQEDERIKNENNSGNGTQG
jgi:hypothetical protein